MCRTHVHPYTGTFPRTLVVKGLGGLELECFIWFIVDSHGFVDGVIYWNIMVWFFFWRKLIVYDSQKCSNRWKPLKPVGRFRRETSGVDHLQGTHARTHTHTHINTCARARFRACMCACVHCVNYLSLSLSLSLSLYVSRSLSLSVSLSLSLSVRVYSARCKQGNASPLSVLEGHLGNASTESLVNSMASIRTASPLHWASSRTVCERL